MSFENAISSVTPRDTRQSQKAKRVEEERKNPQNISNLLNSPIAQDKYGRPASPISLLNCQKPIIQTYDPHKTGEKEGSKKTKKEAVPAQKTGKGVIV